LKAANGKLFSFGITTATVIAIILAQLTPIAQTQSATPFTTADKFAIPQLNGSISFAFNGTYTSATLQNDAWFFKDLTVNNTLVLGNLTISTQNSNVTIYSFYSDALSVIFNRFGYLRYWADGEGTQTVNLNLNTTRQTDPSEWGITNPSGVFLTEGHEWRLLPDNAVMVLGRTGNITVSHYSFNTPEDSNQPFYIQHSVAFITIGVVAATVAAAALISFKTRRNT
jgi:hypothetical protein